MTKRERSISIGVGISMGVLLLNYVIIEPLWASRDKLMSDIAAAEQGLKDDNILIGRRPILDTQWNDIVAHGMVRDSSQAQAQVSAWLNQCAATSGLRFGGLTPDTNASTVNKLGGRPGEKEKNFLRVASRFSGEGGLSQVGEFIWSIQRSPVPMRINELTVSSKSEMQNSQEIRMTVSTIFLAPDVVKPGDIVVQPASTRPANATARGGGSTRPATSFSAASTPATAPISPANAAAIEEQMRLRRLQSQQPQPQTQSAAISTTGPATRTGGQQ